MRKEKHLHKQLKIILTYLPSPTFAYLTVSVSQCRYNWENSFQFPGYDIPSNKKCNNEKPQSEAVKGANLIKTLTKFPQTTYTENQLNNKGQLNKIYHLHVINYKKGSTAKLKFSYLEQSEVEEMLL